MPREVFAAAPYRDKPCDEAPRHEALNGREHRPLASCRRLTRAILACGVLPRSVLAFTVLSSFRVALMSLIVETVTAYRKVFIPRDRQEVPPGSSLRQTSLMTGQRFTAAVEGVPAGGAGVRLPFDPKEEFGKARAPVRVSIGAHPPFITTVMGYSGVAWVGLRKGQVAERSLNPGD